MALILCYIKCLMLLVGVEYRMAGNKYIKSRDFGARIPGVCYLLALWPLSDCLTSYSVSSLTYNMGKVIVPIGVRIEGDKVDSMLCIVFGIS